MCIHSSVLKIEYLQIALNGGLIATQFRVLRFMYFSELKSRTVGVFERLHSINSSKYRVVVQLTPVIKSLKHSVYTILWGAHFN